MKKEIAYYVACCNVCNLVKAEHGWWGFRGGEMMRPMRGGTGRLLVGFQFDQVRLCGVGEVWPGGARRAVTHTRSQFRVVEAAV